MTARMGRCAPVPLLVEWARMVTTEIVALTFCALCERRTYYILTQKDLPNPMTGITALVWGRRNQLTNVVGEVYSSLVLELYYDVGNDRRIDLNAQNFS